MDRKYGSGKSSDKCDKCGREAAPSTKSKKSSVRGQQIKELMAERKAEGHPITLGEASKIIAGK